MQLKQMTVLKIKFKYPENTTKMVFEILKYLIHFTDINI